MNYYSFHIGDYIAHTKHLTPLEDIAYRRIVDAYYLDEKPIQGEAKDVARRICMNDCLTDVEQVLNEFFVFNEKGNCWTNKRCDIEIRKFKDKSKKASEAGKASVLSRQNNKIKNKHTISERLTDVKQTLNQPRTKNQEPRTNIKESTKEKKHIPKKTSPAYTELFLNFWELYPRKTGKGDAFKAWRNRCCNLETYNLIKKALEWQTKTSQWNEQNGAFIPYPATYINGRRWEDEPENKNKSNGSIPRFVPPEGKGWWSSEDLIEQEAKKHGIRMNPLLSNAQIAWQISQAKKENVETSK